MDQIRILTASCFILLNLTALAQIQGIIHDAKSTEPIPFANIWLESGKAGTTSESDGTFQFPESFLNQYLFISAIGYETKKVKMDQLNLIDSLSPKLYYIDEVVVKPQNKNNIITIGKVKKSAIDGHFTCWAEVPYIITRYFPYDSLYYQTPFLKQIKFFTQSSIHSSNFNLRIFTVKDNGSPGEDILTENYIIETKRGKSKIIIDISEFCIQFPQNGIFIAFEWLVIEKNKTEMIYTMGNSKKKHTKIDVEPSFGFVLQNNNSNSWHNASNSWQQYSKMNNDIKQLDGKFMELAVELRLTD